MTPRFALALVLPCLVLAGCSSSSRTSIPGTTPGALRAQASGPTTINLTWSIPWPVSAGVPVPQGSGFVVERRTATTPFAEIARVGLGTILGTKPDELFSEYDDTGLGPNTTYSYRVQPFVGSARSTYSSVAVASTDAPPAPALESLAPDSGYVGGGQRVTLSGQGFQAFSAGTNQVLFGGVPATSVVVFDDESLRCATPPAAGAPGPVDVMVTNANGSAQLEDGFTYFPFPPVFAGEVRVDVTKAAGSARSTRPRLCRSGETLYAVWVDERGFDEDVWFARSLDGGATWESDVRVDHGPVGCATRPEIQCEGDDVRVVWADDRAGAFDIYFNRSTDRGATWLAADVRLNTDPPDGRGSWNPQICGAGSDLWVAFGDDRNGISRGIYVTRSTDAGATWHREVQVDSGGPAAWSVAPQLACDGEDVWVVWEDYRSSVLGGEGDIFVNWSGDGGVTWQPNDTRLDSGPPGAAASANPRICGSGEHVYVVWEDWRDDPNRVRSDIYVARSENGGVTWLPDARLDTDPPGSARSTAPSLSCAGERVFVAWEDYRNDPNAGQPTDGDIFVTRSIDGGATWESEQRIDRDPGTAPAARPQICHDGGNVYVVWEDFRGAAGGPEADIYFNASTDAAEGWLAADQRLDGGAAGSAGSFQPVVHCDGARVWVAWQDFRNDPSGGLLNSDIYFNHTSPTVVR